MRAFMTLAAIAALGWVGVSTARAEKPKKAPSANQEKKVEAKADVQLDQLRAKMHRTMADLIEAQSAKEPDQAKIDKLTKKLASLRQQMRSAAPAAAATPGVAPAAGWRCPWGGPGMGGGRGPAWGGQGRGPGGGRGPAWGGQGRGPGGGRGAGFGPGGGRGVGGPWFVDEDGDGVCDNYERARGQK